MVPFLPWSWKWKTTPNERKLLLEGPIFHFHDCGRKGNSAKIVGSLFSGWITFIGFPILTMFEAGPGHCPNRFHLFLWGFSLTKNLPINSQPKMHVTQVVMPYTLAYLQENDFQNGMNVTWQLLISKIFHVKSPSKRQESCFTGVWMVVSSEIRPNK